ncbi:MAG: hypothetical protein SD837_10950 [Candidatus Electrothrix scaldis]|nr:MAG: hypothetical protein SD837_10950 [Candidatus Electrothrix sp. GW3-3]
MRRKQQHLRPVNSKEYDCPLTKQHVFVQLNGNRHTVHREPVVCSNIGQCGCNVVELIYGMSYIVDWNKCCLYSLIKGQDCSREN